MRVRASLTVIFLGLSLLALGQPFNGGFTGGLTASQIDNDGYGGFNKLGLFAGGFVSSQITENLNWQLGLNYSSRGMYHHPTLQQQYIELIDLKYAELPISLHYFYNEKIQIELGFAPDVLLRAEYQDEYGLLNVEYADELRRFGLTAFAGIHYYFIPRMSVGIKYSYSVYPFYAFDFWTPRYRDRGYFHDVLHLGVQYYFVKQ